MTLTAKERALLSIYRALAANDAATVDRAMSLAWVSSSVDGDRNRHRFAATVRELQPSMEWIGYFVGAGGAR